MHTSDIPTEILHLRERLGGAREYDIWVYYQAGLQTNFSVPSFFLAPAGLTQAVLDIAGHIEETFHLAASIFGDTAHAAHILDLTHEDERDIDATFAPIDRGYGIEGDILGVEGLEQ